ncbi:hypothetical protein L0F63_002194 [Massospora cicadina]|nr:hypothetical protein L0F63_002194 [Massospora cicadina]
MFSASINPRFIVTQKNHLRPVVLQLLFCLIFSEDLGEGILVNRHVFWRRIPKRFEQGRGDPRLKDKPTTQVDSTYLLRLVVKRGD